MRKLATIETIKNIESIENSDNLELATILGWKVVIRKNEFKINDSCIYFSIDSLLPVIPQFKFLEVRGRKTIADGSEGYRLKTIKLRGVLSQGLVFPIKSFPEIKKIKESEDVTELLNVKLYELPISVQLAGDNKGNFPYFLNKSHQERIQNLPEYFEQYKNIEFEESEKLDGTSSTFYWNKGKFGVCSHNIEKKEDDKNIYSKIARELELEKYLVNYGRNIAIQGEICGPSIQNNNYKLLKHQLFIYDIWDIDMLRYLSYNSRINAYHYFKKHCDIKHVPIIRNIKVFEKYNMESLLEHANGQSVLGDMKREGLVYKSIDGSISFKVISNNYLLKEK